MSFKDQLAHDAMNVFMNTQEFAEVRTINGKPTEIIPDDFLLQERKSSASNPTDGVYNATFLFHVLKTDIDKPVIGADLKMGALMYTIADVQEDDAMYTVTLRRFRS